MDGGLLSTFFLRLLTLVVILMHLLSQHETDDGAILQPRRAQWIESLLSTAACISAAATA